jgi:hypothetical protein
MSVWHEFVPQLTKMLRNLDNWLVEAEQVAESKGLDANAWVGARLVEDQYPLSRQVQSACDTVKFALARLSGTEAPTHADTETTIAELRARIGAVLAYADTFSEAQFEGAAERELKPGFLRGGAISGADYLREYVLPNAYFHLVTAYAILRHNGVPLGKRTYLGQMNIKMPGDATG